MLFNSIEFLFIFLPIVFIIYFLLGKIGLIKYTNLWLACASLYFYAYYKIEYLPIIVSSVIFNYIMGYFIQKNHNQNFKKFLLILTICGNLFLLCYYKYFDFSGYCDIALGSAFLFNINLPWNFNSPYKAQSIVEYWNRWNMTLIRFLKDYVFIPLGGNSKGIIRSCFNIMIVFILYGCWKGSNIVNLLYGILNGIFICINKVWEKFNINLPKSISWGITFVTLIILSTFIITKDISQSIVLLKSMFCINAKFTDIMLVNWNLVFNLPQPHNAQINIFLLLCSFIVLLYSKNSNELAQIYVKTNNNFYTFILVLVFIFAALSITRSTEFLYFIF